ncbi:MAG: serine/threonine-protein kinase [Planctomycetaceae bacterium]
MAHADAHISPERFERLLARDAPDADEAALAQHLEACAVCRDELERTAGAPEWWRDAGRYLGLESQHEARDDLQPDDFALEFLAPTDDPAMLGRVGAYEIAGVIGRGGTGIVLKAFERALNRFVAIKLLAPHLATSAAARKRFAREAQAAAAVVHEHIVPIYAVDEHQGLPYMVMRYVPGRSLQERLDRQGTLGLREVLRIGLQTASGLAAAHAQGLVHRDIKPANILLEHGVERVLLTDFGLARTVDEASLTCSGMVAGTPQYMAPEQTRGEAIDHRTDLFSLGSVLYAMCSGHSPFRAETTMGVLHRICTEDPRPLRQQNPEIPEWLERIIRKLHAKQPARRFQSAAEVAEVLGGCLGRLQRGEPLSDPWWRRVGQEIGDTLAARPRLARGVAAAVALIAVAAAAVWYAGWPSRHVVEGPAANSAVEESTSATNGDEGQVTAEAGGLGWQPRAADFDELRQRVEHAERSLLTPTAEHSDDWSPVVKDLRQQLDRLERELPEATVRNDSE